MHQDFEKILFTQEQIARKISEVSSALNADFSRKTPLVVCVLKGASIFFADIIRHLNFCVEIDFIAVSSYGENAHSSGVVQLVKDIERDVKGRDIIIVDDIVDSGLTLKFLKDLFQDRGANSIKILTLLDKRSARKYDIKSDYNCFYVDDEFVAGYGLDFNENYRNLPYIGALRKEIYT